MPRPQLPRPRDLRRDALIMASGPHAMPPRVISVWVKASRVYITGDGRPTYKPGYHAWLVGPALSNTTLNRRNATRYTIAQADTIAAELRALGKGCGVWPA